MHTRLKAVTDFTVTALSTGTVPPHSPHWRAVADNLAHAPGQVKAGLAARFPQGKG